MKREVRIPRWLLVGGVAAALVVGVGAAVGGIGSGPVIKACAAKSNGQLRAVDPATGACKAKEVPLTWSVTGPTGAQGPQGPEGQQGPQGPPGPGAGLAYGYVGADGGVVASRSSAGAGLDWDVAKVGSSYCVRGPVGFKVVLVMPVNHDNWLDDPLLAPDVKHTSGGDYPECDGVGGTQSIFITFRDDDTITLQDLVSTPFEIVFF